MDDPGEPVRHLQFVLSKLRYTAMLGEISCGKERNLTKEQLLQLSDCSYLDRAENILISEAIDSGKRFLACALGHQVCVMGYKSLYLNLNRFTEKITVAKLDGTFVRLLNQLERMSLLILDDFGLAPMDQNTRLALLQILEDRYAKKSIIILLNFQSESGMNILLNQHLPMQLWIDF